MGDGEADASVSGSTVLSWATAISFTSLDRNVTGGNAAVKLPSSVADFLPKEVMQKLQLIAGQSEGRFSIEIDGSGENINLEKVDVDAFWTPGGGAQSKFLLGIADKPKQKAVVSTVLAWAHLIIGGFGGSYFKILTETGQVSVHQLARAILHEAATHNPEWPSGVERKVVKEFPLFTNTGKESLASDFRAIFKLAGTAFAQLVTGSLEEIARVLPKAMLEEAIAIEMNSVQSLYEGSLGVQEKKTSVTEQVFDSLKAQKKIVRFEKKQNGDAKISNGKIKVTVHVPKNIRLDAEDNRLKTNEKGMITSWVEAHRYTLSSAEVKEVGACYQTATQRSLIAERVSRVVEKIRKQELMIDAILDDRRKAVMIDPRWKEAKDEEKTALFSTIATEIRSTFEGDVEAILKAPAYKSRADMLKAIQGK